MKIWYDTEFLEDGKTIDLISIGMVAEDGREYYAVNADMDIERIRKHDWLVWNVLPSLPLVSRQSLDEYLKGPRHASAPLMTFLNLDLQATCVKPRQVIANEVRDFITAEPDPELWAWYGAYDHVVLCQLWGTMIKLPDGVPMWTNDLKQECERLGNPKLPPMPEVTEHNALSDAREVRYRASLLADLAGQPS